MGKLYTGGMNLSKIDKERLIEGEKGMHMNVVIWVNDEPDEYGNHISIQQKVDQDEPRIYLGNAKRFETNGSVSNQDKTDDLPF